jgi:hypothetical protein
VVVKQRRERPLRLTFGAREGQEWGGGQKRMRKAPLTRVWSDGGAGVASNNLKLYVSNNMRGKKSIPRAQETLPTSPGPFFCFCRPLGVLGRVRRCGG